jgi:hypothetical protein
MGSNLKISEFSNAEVYRMKCWFPLVEKCFDETEDHLTLSYILIKDNTHVRRICWSTVKRSYNPIVTLQLSNI